MKKLFIQVGWDLKMLVRYKVIAVAIFVTLLYSFSFILLPIEKAKDLLIILIFSDPAMLGFIFIGAMVLFEKDENTLQAIVVTPVAINQYLLSKTIALTIVSLVCSFIMAMAAVGFNFNGVVLFLGVVLTSALFILVGFIGVARVKSFNQYIIIIPLAIIPMILPLLDFLDIFHSISFYVWPTQGSFILFKGAFDHASIGEITYSVMVLGLWIYQVFIFAANSFRKQIIEG